LIALVQREHGLTVLFTRRTTHLSQHAGQISFPGGGSEPQDKDPIETALRETREEIGLGSDRVDVIGQLPPYHTVTGYRVIPVVGVVTDMPSLTPDENEVEEIFEVPLQFLMNGAVHQRRTILIPGDESREFQRSHRTFYAMPYQNYFIWGATAGMLRNLFHFLRA
jgi:8-oxo-dGTP pyrophosphatase MutT (NUDIX family)